jgi:SOS-response transcriptional repressor LexA
MTSFNGGKSIPEGSVIIVDPNVPAEHGKVVVARLEESNEATLKQLVIDGGVKYLKPFNSSYPTMPINGNCTIIGVVKQLIQDF